MSEAQPTEDFEFAALSEARNYREALVREFKPFLKGRVLEIGAGIGQMTPTIADQPLVTEVVAVEPEKKFIDRFQGAVAKVTVVHGTAAAIQSQNWNAVVSINVLEHIEHDEGELRLYRDLLADQKGYLCLFVPARPEIYAPIDHHFGHFRRYRRRSLRDKLKSAGFEVEQLSYFNFIGYFAWAINFRLLGNRSFNVQAVRFFDRVVFPLGHRIETSLVRPPIGQSLLAIARSVRP